MVVRWVGRIIVEAGALRRTGQVPIFMWRQGVQAVQYHFVTFLALVFGELRPKPIFRQKTQSINQHVKVALSLKL